MRQYNVRPRKLIYRRMQLDGVEATCVSSTIREWEEMMKNKKVANKRVIDRLVKEQLPELYENLQLKYRNPYQYYITPKHVVLVHSAIEYFITYQAA